MMRDKLVLGDERVTFYLNCMENYTCSLQFCLDFSGLCSSCF